MLFKDLQGWGEEATVIAHHLPEGAMEGEVEVLVREDDLEAAIGMHPLVSLFAIFAMIAGAIFFIYFKKYFAFYSFLLLISYMHKLNLAVSVVINFDIWV